MKKVAIIVLMGTLFLIFIVSCSDTGVPTGDSIQTTYCIYGYVKASDTGNPIANAYVVVEYNDGSSSHICSSDYSDLNGYYYCDMEGHCHNDTVTITTTPPDGSGYEETVDHVYFGEVNPSLFWCPLPKPWDDPDDPP